MHVYNAAKQKYKLHVCFNLSFCSGYFNGARFFQGDRSESKNAAGAMYVIMGFLWLVALPVLILVIIMVSE